MPKILCTLPNASDEISGVKFSPRPDGPGVVSDEIHQDLADGFLAIPGYELVLDTAAADKAAAEARAAAEAQEKAAAEAAAKQAAEAEAAIKAAAAEAEKADLVARAAVIDFKVKANWSLERLKAEVESAEKAAADAAAAKTE